MISLAHKSITIDVNNRNAPNVVAIANVNDKAVRYLDVTLTASGEKLTFADCSVTATFATDGYLISDSVACTLNSTADMITVPLEDFKSMSGFLAIEIKIANGETQVLNTPLTLKVMVTPSLAENSKISGESVGSFAEISREVVTARGGQNSLGARLDTVDTNLAKKANKSDIDSIKSRLQSAEQNLHSKANATDVANTLKSKEDNLNKVSSKTDITDSSANYPSIEYLGEYYYDANESYSSAETDELLENKADKATTLAGYGITDAYTKEKTDQKLAQKLNSMPFDSEPKNNSPCYLTSGAVYNALLVKADKTALATKYDSSNIESGTSTLTPHSTVTDKIKNASCVYKKIGDTVIVNATLIMNPVTLGGNSIWSLTDLPFIHNSDTPLYFTGMSNKGNMFKGAISKKSSWLSFQTLNKTQCVFTDDEQINFSLIYKI